MQAGSCVGWAAADGGVAGGNTLLCLPLRQASNINSASLPDRLHRRSEMELKRLYSVHFVPEITPLLRKLQPRRAKQFAHMRGSLILPDPADDMLSNRTWRQHLGLLA